MSPLYCACLEMTLWLLENNVYKLPAQSCANRHLEAASNVLQYAGSMHFLLPVLPLHSLGLFAMFLLASSPMLFLLRD